MTVTPDLRSRAEALGQTLPPLLAEAEMLASTVMICSGSRMKPGLSASFEAEMSSTPGSDTSTGRFR